MFNGLGNRRPSMNDVARLAGVSHQTVSRVLNGTGSVSEETQENVRRAIDELGYRPNFAARALVTRQSGLLGVITTTSVHYGPASMLLAVDIAAKALGILTVTTALESYTKEELKQATDKILSLGVDAIVFIEPRNTTINEFGILNFPIPVVAVMSPQVGKRIGIPTAHIDQAAGVQAIIEHIINLGHTNIYHVMGETGWYAADIRATAYSYAMLNAGLIPKTVGGDSWDSECGYKIGLELMENKILPTAIFCANDSLALGVMSALRGEGIKIPEDISVVGFDDIPESAFFDPPLTTVRQDFWSIGKKIVSMLVEACKTGEAKIENVSLPVEIILRQSTAQRKSKETE